MCASVQEFNPVSKPHHMHSIGLIKVEVFFFTSPSPHHRLCRFHCAVYVFILEPSKAVQGEVLRLQRFGVVELSRVPAAL